MNEKQYRSRDFLRLLNTLLDVILPPRCSGSGKIVDNVGSFNPDFWDKIRFIERPFCNKCGLPFSFEDSTSAICGECMIREHHFDNCRSAVVYNEASGKIIHGFKFNDKTHFIHNIATPMIKAGKELIDKADLIIAVPLHTSRLRQRLFNQSAIIAKEIAAYCEKKYSADGMIRVKTTLPQRGLSRKQRLQNVIGAFAVNNKYDYKNLNILLIDDVYTTGATLDECAKMLKKAGALEVNILTFARTVIEE